MSFTSGMTWTIHVSCTFLVACERCWLAGAARFPASLSQTTRGRSLSLSNPALQATSGGRRHPSGRWRPAAELKPAQLAASPPLSLPLTFVPDPKPCRLLTRRHRPPGLDQASPSPDLGLPGPDLAAPGHLRWVSPRGAAASGAPRGPGRRCFGSSSGSRAVSAAASPGPDPTPRCRRGARATPFRSHLGGDRASCGQIAAAARPGLAALPSQPCARGAGAPCLHWLRWPGGCAAAARLGVGCRALTLAVGRLRWGPHLPLLLASGRAAECSCCLLVGAEASGVGHPVSPSPLPSGWMAYAHRWLTAPS
jgi:hypothetical protein